MTSTKKRGRPGKYDPAFIAKADEYLELHQDGFDVELYNQTKGQLGLKVQLPTIEGFAAFIGVHKDTLYEWASIHDIFSDALTKIKAEQHKRLIDKGLSGTYNSTIAKLVLSSNHGYAEKSESQVTADVVVTELSTEEKQSLLNLLDDKKST